MAEDIYVIVAPKQKIVKICSHKNRCILKVYRFKEDVPKIKKTIQVEGYDYGEWCVSERAFTTEKVVTVYDEGVIESIRKRALDYFLQNDNK